MINISELLYEICEDECVYDENFDLIENGILDSFTYIEFFSKLEDYGIFIHPTQIDRKQLRTVKSISELLKKHS